MDFHYKLSHFFAILISESLELFFLHILTIAYYMMYKNLMYQI